jgi:hypothetical protein
MDFNVDDDGHHDQLQVDPLRASSSSLSDRIASCALHHYHRYLVGNKGKPKPDEEWTVYAALVAVVLHDHHRDHDQIHSNCKNMWVVSCATGTKCTTQYQDYNGCVLHDSHAEVLAKRGLVRVLWKEIISMERKNKSLSSPSLSPSPDAKKEKGHGVFNTAKHPPLLVPAETTTPKKNCYRLNPKIQLHLYSSDSPCGDASIYNISVGNDAERGGGREDDDSQQKRRQQHKQEVLFTGAKIVVSNATGVTALDCGGDHQLLSSTSSHAMKNRNNSISENNNNDDDHPHHNENKKLNGTAGVVVAREEIQVLGKLRTKSGRSNLPSHLRSTSMSCSDKLVLWSVLGLQGGLLTTALNPPFIQLSSIVVSSDPRTVGPDNYHQRLALERAVPSRVKEALDFLKKSRPKMLSWKPEIPTVNVVSKIYCSGKAVMSSKESYTQTDVMISNSTSGQKRKHGAMADSDSNNNKSKKRALSPCGVALNWNQFDMEIEVLVGSRGVRQGRKPKSPNDYLTLASRLSQTKTVSEIPLRLIETSSEQKEEQSTQSTKVTYRYMKKNFCNPDWSAVKTQLLTLEGSPLRGWLRSENDFEVRES